jgi:hypothetical protein
MIGPFLFASNIKDFSRLPRLRLSADIFFG